MRRITKVKNNENVLLMEECKDNWSISSNKAKTRYWIRGTAVDRLAAYEDTGLTPEEVKDMCKDNDRIQKLIDRDTAKGVDEEDCCPICNTYGKDDEGVQGKFCPNCGQRLDWGDDNA